MGHCPQCTCSILGPNLPYPHTHIPGKMEAMEVPHIFHSDNKNVFGNTKGNRGRGEVGGQIPKAFSSCSLTCMPRETKKQGGTGRAWQWERPRLVSALTYALSNRSSHFRSLQELRSSDLTENIQPLLCFKMLLQTES